MQPGVDRNAALILGGTGAVGSAVLGELTRRGLPARFTYFRNGDKAKALSSEHGQPAHQVDLGDLAAVESACRQWQAEGFRPSRVIACAGIAASQSLAALELSDLRRTLTVTIDSMILITKWLASSDAPCDIVFVGGLDRTQSLPLPPALAASQGALAALTMSLAHELGPKGFRVNMVALGVLSEGLSKALAVEQKRQYEQFSALRRVGTPVEVARVIAWLACENTYIHGKTLSVNGGI